VRTWSLGRNEAGCTSARRMRRYSVLMLAAIVVTLSGCVIGYHVNYDAPYSTANAATSLATAFCDLCESLNMEKRGDSVIGPTRSINYNVIIKSEGVNVSLFIIEGRYVEVYIDSAKRENPFALRCRTEIERLLKVHGFTYRLQEWKRGDG